MAKLTEEEKRAAYEAEKLKVQELFTAVSIGSVERLNTFVLNELNGEHELLLQYKDGNGRNVLHFAGGSGQAEMCKYLIDRCKPNDINEMVDKEGHTPWSLAVRTGHYDAFIVLSKDKLKRKISAQVMFDAASSGNVDILHHLLDQLEDKSVLNKQRSIGTCLHGAVFAQNAKCVSLLLENGADVNVADSDGVTPLIVACSQHSKDIVSLLLKHKADVEAATKDGSNCFHAAATSGENELLGILLNAHPDASARNINGLLPIELAAIHNHASTVELLLKHSELEGVTTAEELINNVNRTRDEAKMSMLSQKESVSQEIEAQKKNGNAKFQAGDFIAAIDAYSEAIQRGEDLLTGLSVHKDYAPEVHDKVVEEFSAGVLAVVYSNRCMCLLNTSRVSTALKDAERASQLAPKWPKAKYRLGQCHTALCEYPEAAQAYWDGYQLAPKDDGAQAMFKLFKASVKLGKQQVKDKAEEREKAKAKKELVLDQSTPIEVPIDASGQNFKTIMLRYNKTEAPAEAAGRFVSENKLDPSLVPRIAHHLHTIMQSAKDN